MKKYLLLILAFVLMLGCCACGETPLEKAIAEVDEFLKECKVADCVYIGQLQDNYKYYVVVMTPEEANTNNSAECAIMEAIANKVQEFVVPELDEIFKDVGIPVEVRIYDRDMTAHIELANGQREHLD